MKYLFSIFLMVIVLSGCSFDDKTGIWTGSDKIRKITKKNDNLKPVFTKQNNVLAEINLTNEKVISLDKSQILNNWNQRFANDNNHIKHLKFKNIGNYEKYAKISKNTVNSDIIYFRKKLIFSDSKGNIGVYSLEKNQLLFNFNFYKKKFKKIKKKISLIAKNDLIIAADNLGYIYCLDLKYNKLKWAKNFLVPFRSNIKIIDNTLFISDEKNKIILVDISTGNKIDEFYTQPAKAVSQYENNLAVDNNKNLIFLSTTGGLYSLNLINAKIINWIINFNSENEIIFNAKPVIIYKDKIFITTNKSISLFSDRGIKIWEVDMQSDVVPIISGNTLFTITKKNYLVVLDTRSGEIIYSKKLKNIIKNSYKKDYSKKIKRINNVFLFNNKLLLISNNVFFIELDIRDNFKVTSIKKKSFDISSDVISLNKNLVLIGDKNKLYKVF